MIPPKMTAADWGLTAALSILWGGAFIMIELGLRSFPPITLVFLRMAIAVPPMLIALKLMGQHLPRDAKSWGQLAIVGLLNCALPFMLFFWGQQYLDSGFASVLNATTPLWVVPAAHFLTRDEKATPLHVVGVLLGMAGIIVMVGRDAVSGLSDSLLAQIACLISTLFYCLAAIYGRRLSQSTMTPTVVAAGQTVAAAIFMLPIMLFIDQPWTLPAPSFASVLAAVWLGLMSTALAYFLYFRLIDRAGASNAMLVAFIMPVVAIILGVMVLGEVIHLREMVGALLIALGLLAIDGRIFKPLRRVPS